MSTPQFTFPSRLRLTHDREFQAVFDARVWKGVHPIVVYGRPNDLPHCRLGLSVSRRVNSAVRRNRIKRLLRESFRLMQHEMPGTYDLVVVARPHDPPRELSWYQQALRECIASIHRQWTSPRSTSMPDRPGRPVKPDSPRES